MFSLEKWMILISLQKLPKRVEDLDKLDVAKGFKSLHIVRYIAQSGHTYPFVYFTQLSPSGGAYLAEMAGEQTGLHGLNGRAKN